MNHHDHKSHRRSVRLAGTALLLLCTFLFIAAAAGASPLSPRLVAALQQPQAGNVAINKVMLGDGGDSLTGLNNDRPGVAILSNPLFVAEGGASASYELKLTSRPEAEVVIEVIGDGQVAIDNDTLVFTADDWSLPKLVTVRAVDDLIDEQDGFARISHRVSSADPRYNGLDIGKVELAIVDNDTAGIEISPLHIKASVGGQASYQMRLLTQPVHDVLVDVSTTGPIKAAEFCVNHEGPAACVQFTPQNWDTPQIVVVRGLAQGSGQIVHTVVSDDVPYHVLAVPAVRVDVESYPRIFLPFVSGR